MELSFGAVIGLFIVYRSYEYDLNISIVVLFDDGIDVAYKITTMIHFYFDNFCFIPIKCVGCKFILWRSLSRFYVKDWSYQPNFLDWIPCFYDILGR